MSTVQGYRALLLYLDYDGPLHPSDVYHDGGRCYFRSVVGHVFFEHAPLLDQMLEPYPDVHIVLSTRWAFLFGLEKAASFLHPGLQRRVIGCTCDFASSPAWDTFARGAQVVDDVEARQPADWFALDDDGAGWPKQHRKRLVVCDSNVGLADAATQKRLASVLKRMDSDRRRRNRLAMRRIDINTYTSGSETMEVVPQDGADPVEIEIHHLVAIDRPPIRLTAGCRPHAQGHLFEIWNSAGRRISSVTVPEPTRGEPHPHWVMRCLQRALASGAGFEPRPVLGSGTVWIRVSGSVAYARSFTLCGDRASYHVNIDASDCPSLWDVAVRVICGLPEPRTRASNPWVLALDLEGTLISSAVSVFVRPGLYRFLACSRSLVGRVVAFTTVSEVKFREVANVLVDEGSAPGWFADVEYVQWSGNKKDLSFIPGAEPAFTLLVDDMEQSVCEGQRSQWIAIKGYDPLFESDDRELDGVLEVLARRTAL